MNQKKSANSEKPTGAGRIVLVAGTSFLVGAALTGAWFGVHSLGAPKTTSNKLSDESVEALRHLGQPVTVRFYSILPNANNGEVLTAFSGRIYDLLTQIRTASGTKVQFVRIDTQAETNAAAATTDGIQPFDLDKGDACFLGMTVSSGEHKDTLAHLDPAWGAAVEYDLVRAIQRVAVAPPAAMPAPEIAKPSPQTLDAIKRLIPDPAAVSQEDANRIFHAEFMKDCAQVAADMENEITTAQQQLAQARNSGSETEIAAAQKHLLEVQLQRGDQLKQVADELQTRLAVFQQLKSGATNSNQ